MKGSKDKYYFSHDSNARRDPKMIPIIQEFGSAGYGMFWILVEILREQGDYKIDITKNYMILSLSTEMHTDKDNVVNFIDRCIENQLIDTDGIFIWSNSLCKRMEIYEEKKKRYSEMGKKRWNLKQQDQKPEIEKQEERSTKEKFNFKKALIDIGVAEKTASTWLEVRRKKGAINSEMAFNRVRKQIELSGFPAEFCIGTAAEKSWHGFEAQYLEGIAMKDRNLNAGNKMVY